MSPSFTPGRVVTALFAAVAILSFSASPAAAERYVAMGDSYSSGTGTNDYYDATCQRSNFAYGSLIKADIGGTFRMAACSGAKSGEVLTNTQNGNPAQVTLLGNDTEYVTISIGGNDADFTGTLLECGKPDIWPLSPDCSGAIATSQDIIRNTVPGRLDTVFTRIRQRSPNARISLVGYPRLFPANGNDCGSATFFSADEISKLNQTADLLADVERTRARANGATYVDARPAFLGHAWCEDEWINGLSNPTSDSFHPNKPGHVGYSGIVRAAVLAAPDAGRTAAPNGRIVFTATEGTGSSITLINANGTFRTDLTGSTSRNEDPVFSPDGSRIAFASNRGGTGFDIYTMKIDGTDLRRLTTATGDDREPGFSPNGAFLAFRSTRTGNAEIFRMTVDGGTQTNLTKTTGVSSISPDWSPDGSEIAFQRSGEVFRMNADGQGQTNITGNGATIEDGRPVFSPDGSKIAFHSNRDGNFEIYTISPTGGSASRRTTDGSSDRDPSFSPDGSQIVFRSNREGADRIFTMASVSGSATRKTSTTTTDSRPNWQGDRTPPSTTITAGPQGLTNSNTPSFTFQANEAGSTFECRIGAAAYQSCASPLVGGPLADGSHTFQVRSTDPSGNVETAPVSRSFSIDTRAKVTTIETGPSGATNVSSPVFGFSSEVPGVTFECRLTPGGQGWQACSSPHTVAGLADGVYSLEVRGTDPAGNVEAEPPVRHFTVDTVAPAATISTAPAALSNDPTPPFEFASTEAGADHECSLVPSGSDDSWVACTSPFTSSRLDDGSYTFRVRATDLAGNRQVSPALWVFAVDTVAPATSITAGPDGTVETRDVEFEFSADDEVASFECRLDSFDDSAWTACGSPLNLTGLEHGLHSLQVRASDPAGNIEAEPASIDFGVDVIRPDVTVDSVPADPSAERRPSFSFHSVDPDARFECRIDPPAGAGEWAQCVSPFRPESQLGEGTHTFQVRAADVFGHTDASEPVSWTVDAVAPVARIADGPVNSSASRTARFELAADEELPVYACSLDGGAWTACGPAVAYNDLVEGQHEFRTRAAGPLSGTGPVISRSWKVDLTSPVLTLDSVPVDPNRSTSAELRFSSNEATTYECRLDSVSDGAFAPCSSPHSVFRLADGEHSVDVRGTDGAGNRSVVTASWSVFTSSPSIFFDTAPAPFVNSRAANIVFSSNRTIASAECRIDAHDWSPCTSPVSYEDLRDGPHDLAVRVTDQAGNVATSGRSWTVDTVAPVVTIESGPATPTTDQTAEFGFRTRESGTRFECSVDGAPFNRCNSPHRITGITIGQHRIAVRATDRAGNTSPAATRGWSVETVPASPVAPVIRVLPSVKVPKNGKARIATIICGSDSCDRRSVGRVRFRVAGRRYIARILATPALKAGQGAAVYIKLTKRTQRALRGRKAKATVSISINAGEQTTKVRRRLTLRG